MTKLVRALIVSGVATGVAAAVFRAIQPPERDDTPRRAMPKGDPYVDADRIDDDARDALLDELSGQL